MDLTDQVVIVTCSSSGIGEAAARRLASLGARVVVNSSSSVDAGERFGGDGVRVNAVAPGLVATPWTSEWALQKDVVSQMAPLHRVAEPDDVVDACIGLIGSRYATGQTLVVDGGLGLVI